MCSGAARGVRVRHAALARSRCTPGKLLWFSCGRHVSCPSHALHTGITNLNDTVAMAVRAAR
eukprot:2578453-Prymnesium_polylepis.1